MGRCRDPDYALSSRYPNPDRSARDKLPARNDLRTRPFLGWPRVVRHADWLKARPSRCSTHPLGIARVSSSSCMPFGCLPVEDLLLNLRRRADRRVVEPAAKLSTARQLGIPASAAAGGTTAVPRHRGREADQSDTSVKTVSLSAAYNGAQGRNRTTDTRIFSPLLYQLSYLGVHRAAQGEPVGSIRPRSAGL